MICIILILNPNIHKLDRKLIQCVFLSFMFFYKFLTEFEVLFKKFKYIQRILQYKKNILKFCLINIFKKFRLNFNILIFFYF